MSTREGWRYRCVEECKGNTTIRGLMLLSAIGIHSSRPPWFGPTCIIDPDGFVFTNFVDRAGDMHEATYVCHVSDMIEGFRRLADKLKLTDAERDELFNAIRMWVHSDGRADPDWAALRQEAGAPI